MARLGCITTSRPSSYPLPADVFPSKTVSEPRRTHQDHMNAQPPAQSGGIYPIRVAARLAHLHPTTVTRRVEGYTYPYKGQTRSSGPVAPLAETAANEDRLLNFQQLLTLLLVKAFKDKGLSLVTIKKAAARARDTYQVENPFASNRFRSDGHRVFIELDRAPSPERPLIDVLSDQHQFRAIVEPSLFDDVVFAGDHAGEWWPLHRDHDVLLTPNRQFGAPHIAGTGIQTDVLAQAVKAEGSGRKAIEAVAAWFGVKPKQVDDAVAFEGPWLANRTAA